MYRSTKDLVMGGGMAAVYLFHPLHFPAVSRVPRSDPTFGGSTLLPKTHTPVYCTSASAREGDLPEVQFRALWTHRLLMPT